MSEDGMSPDEVAKRAMELAARAEELARHAHETAGIDEQLAQLEAELDALDAEEAGLSADEPGGAGRQGRQDVAPGPVTSDWADALTERVGSLGDRIGVLVEHVTEAAMHRVESTLAADLDDAVEEYSVAVDGPSPIRIESHGGAVHVQGHADNTVSVIARGRRVADDARLAEMETSGGTVTITSRNQRHWRGRGVRLDVKVPFGSPLTISTGGGGVHVDDVHGTADVRTGGGSIHVSRAREHVDLLTGGGGIEVVDVDGAVRARTGGGSIHVDGRLSGASSLRSGGGNITIRVADGTNIRVEGRGTGSASDIDSVETHHGRISGRVGDGSGGELDAKTGGGTIRIVR